MEVGKAIKNTLKKQVTKKLFNKAKKKILLYIITTFMPLILGIIIVVTLFSAIPLEINSKPEYKDIKNYAINLTDKTNKSNLYLENGSRIDDFCDSMGRDKELALKWSDLFAMVQLTDTISSDSKSKLIEKEFDKLAEELKSIFKYKESTRKVTLTKKVEVKNKKGEVTGTEMKTFVISEDPVYLLTSADTIYGYYTYQYESKTDVKKDSEGTWTTTYLDLTSTSVKDEYKRLDECLKKYLKITNDKKTIEETRAHFLELSKGINENIENSDWLLGDNYGSNLVWKNIANSNIDSEIMEAVLYSSKKYNIPPWLILGFIYRESNFNKNTMSCDDLGVTVKVSDILNNEEYLNHSQRSLGLMQVTRWKDNAISAGYDYKKDALNPKAQVEIGVKHLIGKFNYDFININPATVDWKGDGWIEQTWLGCQAYNGLIYYNTDKSKTKQYAFTRYLRNSDNTGVFDMAEKYKAMFEIDKDGNYNKKSSWPVPGVYDISSPFGMRINPVTGASEQFHNGIDIPASMGTPVVSVANGQVVHSGELYDGYGIYVVIRDGTYDYLYAHLSSTNVKKGDKITVGQNIGKVGSTGYSTGPHLHFGVSKGSYLNKTWIDPLKIVSN